MRRDLGTFLVMGLFVISCGKGPPKRQDPNRGPDPVPDCIAQDCAAASATCGQVADGCGLVLECGSCAGAETCGGGGQNRCGSAICAPNTCEAASAECGQLSDGCSAVLNCGVCSDDQLCEQNRCVPRGTQDGGARCIPLTCLQSKAGCGPISDGCGGTLFCGKCERGFQCSQSTHACAPACTSGCPDGSTCDGNGTCVGGNLSQLNIDLKAYELTGTVTVNGVPLATYAAGCVAGSTVATVFADSNRTAVGSAVPLYRFNTNIVCGQSEWKLLVYPDDYRLYVSTQDAKFLRVGSATVTQSAAVGALDVKPLAVAGTVKVNGAPIKPAGGCTKAMDLKFLRLETGDANMMSVSCLGTFSGALLPGRYRISAIATSGVALPKVEHTVMDAVILAPQNDLLLNLSVSSLSGSTAVDGKVGIPDCSAETVLRFTETRSHNITQVSIPCDGSEWSVRLYSGIYDVDMGYSPLAMYRVGQSMVINSDLMKLKFEATLVDVGGSVSGSFNGKALTACGTGTIGGWIQFVSTATGNIAATTSLPCNAWLWSTKVQRGTYDIKFLTDPVRGIYLTVAKGLSVVGPQIDINRSFSAAKLTGTVTQNGNPITGTAYCSSTTRQQLRLYFTETTTQDRFSIPIPCGTNSFALDLTPGTFRVEANSDGQSSSLPYGWSLLEPGFVHTAAKTGVGFDARLINVSGTVTVNGKPYVDDPVCSQTFMTDVVRFNGTYSVPIPCTGNSWSYPNLHLKQYWLTIVPRSSRTTFGALPEFYAADRIWVK